MEIDSRYSALIKDACERVRRNKGINVSFSSIEFYGIQKYSGDNVYKVKLMTDMGLFTLYQDDLSLTYWANVPWSGLTDFRPRDFEDWPENKKLILAWCWAVYNYCKNLRQYWNQVPPEIEE